MSFADKIIDLNLLVQANELKIGVISDTHNFVNEKIIETLKACDIILHAGDIGDAKVIKSLLECTPHVFCVRGNNDVKEKWPQEDINELETIPENIELQFNNQKLAVTHGHQYYKVEVRHDKLRDQFPNADIIIYGHSHIITCDQVEKPWVINPGAGGKTRTKGGASCMMMSYQNNSWNIRTIRDLA